MQVGQIVRFYLSEYHCVDKDFDYDKDRQQDVEEGYHDNADTIDRLGYEEGQVWKDVPCTMKVISKDKHNLVLKTIKGFAWNGDGYAKNFEIPWQLFTDVDGNQYIRLLYSPVNHPPQKITIEYL